MSNLLLEHIDVFKTLDDYLHDFSGFMSYLKERDITLHFKVYNMNHDYGIVYITIGSESHDTESKERKFVHYQVGHLNYKDETFAIYDEVPNYLYFDYIHGNQKLVIGTAPFTQQAISVMDLYIASRRLEYLESLSGMQVYIAEAKKAVEKGLEPITLQYLYDVNSKKVYLIEDMQVHEIVKSYESYNVARPYEGFLYNKETITEYNKFRLINLVSINSDSEFIEVVFDDVIDETGAMKMDYASKDDFVIFNSINGLIAPNEKYASFVNQYIKDFEREVKVRINWISK